MNLLAHAFLSFGETEILVGNMISDHVKGKKKFEYPNSVQKGISLHRAIDEFTDNHPQTSIAKQYFRADYRLYSGAFIDVVYDHFLANDPLQFPDDYALQIFAGETYSCLFDYRDILPAGFKSMLPYMQTQNWLYNYKFRGGIEKSFGGLVRRARYLNESIIAFKIFESNYNQLHECYRRFFPELKEFAFMQLQLLNK